MSRQTEHLKFSAISGDKLTNLQVKHNCEQIEKSQKLVKLASQRRSP